MKGSKIQLPGPLEAITHEEMERKRAIGGIMSRTLSYLTDRFVTDGFNWLLPVVLSKTTDPLWPDPGASIEKRIEVEIYGEAVRATLSMIIHKMVASSLAYPKLFILSPNIRIERRERGKTGVHIYEFTQLDFEVRSARSEDIKGLVETSLQGLVRILRREAREEMETLGRYDALGVLQRPFRSYDRTDLMEEHGEAWESAFTSSLSSPAWVTNIPREFYDFEEFETGQWDNYDLFVPQVGEILSGARRESELSKIEAKMARDGVRRESYELILKLAREGRLLESAGAGIGIERLVAWLVGARHVGEVQPFPKIPGKVYDL